MSKVHSSESETLDEKIKRIRKKNEEIEKRRLEVEADKQTAAKLNALVQLNAPKEDWPLPRSHSPDEERGRKVAGNHQEKTRERCRGNVTFGDTVDEANRPPPDPAYRFLADAERDPIPTKNPDRSQRHSRGRGHGLARGRGRDHKGRLDGPPSGRGTPVYEAWRAERNRIDEERIRRQRTAQGQWRREWDSQKSEEDWEALRGERARDQNTTLNRPSRTSEPPESAFTDITKNKTYLEERKGEIVNSGKNVSRNLNSSPSHSGQVLKSIVQANENHNVQSSANVSHMSFANEPTVKKATSVKPTHSLSAPSTSRRAAVGSGRVGLPPPRPQHRRPAPDAAGPSAEALPQRRPREGRARRRPAALTGGASWGRREAAARKSGRKSSGDGDESWEDADDHSDQEGRAPQDASAQLVLATPPPSDDTEGAGKSLASEREGEEVDGDNAQDTGDLEDHGVGYQDDSLFACCIQETKNLQDTLHRPALTADVEDRPMQECLDNSEGYELPTTEDYLPGDYESEVSGATHHEDHGEGSSDSCCVAQVSKTLPTDDSYDTVTAGNDIICTSSGGKENYPKEDIEGNVENLVANEKATDVLVSKPVSNAIDSAAAEHTEILSVSCVATENLIQATNSVEISKEMEVLLLQPDDSNASQEDRVSYIAEEPLEINRSTIQSTNKIAVNTSEENIESTNTRGLDESTEVLQCGDDSLVTEKHGTVIELLFEDDTKRTCNATEATLPVNTSSNDDSFFETSNERANLKSTTVESNTAVCETKTDTENINIEDNIQKCQEDGYVNRDV